MAGRLSAIHGMHARTDITECRSPSPSCTPPFTAACKAKHAIQAVLCAPHACRRRRRRQQVLTGRTLVG